MQDISSFIMINIIFFISLFSYGIYNLNQKIILLIFLSLLAMVLAGVRAPFIGLFIGLGIILWYKNKNIFTVSIITFAILTFT